MTLGRWPPPGDAVRPRYGYGTARGRDRRGRLGVGGRRLLPSLSDARIRRQGPAFTLQDENGEKVALTSLKGRTVVFYFSPNAEAPG